MSDAFDVRHERLPPDHADVVDDLDDPDARDALDRVATRRERVASRKLARVLGLTPDAALRRTLEASAGPAGLAALVAARLAQQRAAEHALQAAADRRTAARAATLAAVNGRRAPRPGDTAGGSGWQAWFDGSARPNPGRCAIGALLCGPDGTIVEIAEPAGHGDSSDAEYRALIAVLDAALAHGATNLVVHGDSRVVIDDVNGPDAAASPLLSAYRVRVRAQLAALAGARLRWVPRHRNVEADALSQRACLPAEEEPAGL